MDSPGSGQGPKEGSCEHGREHSDSTDAKFSRIITIIITIVSNN
jgi:hypothetical protein